MIEPDIVDRLNGIVRVPVNDGAGLLDGKDFFERQFPTSKLAREAAAEIAKLRAERDAAARDMRERCIAAARAHGAWAEKMIEENGVDPVHFGTIANAADDIGALISALPATVIATDGETNG